MDLRELWDGGRQAWPEVDLSEERFAELLCDLPTGVADEAAAELYLACAWVAGVASAGQVMARDYFPPLRRRLARMGLAAASDPRAELMRLQKQAVFKAAVEAALEALEPRERTVLRLHLIDGLTLDEIGDYFKVHRVTVSRWLAAARVAIIERAREAARAQFGLSDTEFDAAYTGSQLGLSLERLLGD